MAHQGKQGQEKLLASFRRYGTVVDPDFHLFDEFPLCQRPLDLIDLNETARPVEQTLRNHSFRERLFV